MDEQKFLVTAWSPVCDICAMVDRNNSCCYFYLWVKPEMEDTVLKKCWICNVSDAPEEIDVEGMKQGIAPAIPKEYVLRSFRQRRWCGEHGTA